MLALIFGNDFWLSSTPLLLTGLLAGLVVLVWDWRISLPAVFLIQLFAAEIATQRLLMPGQWSRVFVWVIVGCLLILLLSLQQSSRTKPKGPTGTVVFRGLLLALAAFLLNSADIEGLLPLLDRQVTHLVLWLALCAFFGLATGEGALANGLALLLWLIGAEVALIAVTPAALIVVLLGMLFLLISLACGYLLVAENMALAAQNQPLTDITFPVEATRKTSTATAFTALRRKAAEWVTLGQRGNQPQ